MDRHYEESGGGERPPSGWLSDQDALSIMSGLASAFYVLDENSHFLYINDLALRLLGREGEELVGRHVSAEFPDAEDSGLLNLLERIRSTGVSEQKDFYYRPGRIWLNVDVQHVGNGRVAVLLHDISRYKNVEDRLEYLAFYDDLTGLPNRRAAIKMIEDCVRDNKRFSVVLYDIDSFRQLNDLHGHEAGDFYIREIARRLKSVLNEGETMARIGGDEFLFLTSRSDPDELDQWIRELLKMTNLSVRLNNHISFSASASVGISRHPEDGKTSSELFSMADTAMYESKTQRGSCFSIFKGEMKTKLERRRVIEDDLFSGEFQRKGFHFAVQPQLDGRTGRLVGFEVLSRWNHPELGELSPYEFIQVAEECGMIKELTMHLFHLVLGQASEWVSKYGDVPKIAVNVTPHLLDDKMFFSNLMKSLRKYHIPPDRFEIEISEWTKLLSSDLTLSNLRKCRSKGITVAIDDFGTGFSGLSYLTYFPVDTIKVDRFFISGIGTEGKSEAILKSIVSLAHGLGCQLVAEGVETEEQLEFLLDIGCRGVQGYYYDAPLSFQSFEKKYMPFFITT